MYLRTASSWRSSRRADTLRGMRGISLLSVSGCSGAPSIENKAMLSGGEDNIVVSRRWQHFRHPIPGRIKSTKVDRPTVAGCLQHGRHPIMIAPDGRILSPLRMRFFWGRRKKTLDGVAARFFIDRSAVGSNVVRQHRKYLCRFKVVFNHIRFQILFFPAPLCGSPGYQSEMSAPAAGSALRYRWHSARSDGRSRSSDVWQSSRAAQCAGVSLSM